MLCRLTRTLTILDLYHIIFIDIISISNNTYIKNTMGWFHNRKSKLLAYFFRIINLGKFQVWVVLKMPKAHVV